MIAYPAISPLTGDRHALQQLIGMTGLGDRHHPESLIDITGIRMFFRIRFFHTSLDKDISQKASSPQISPF